MAKVDKLIEKMKARPNGIRFAEIAKVLQYHGYIEVRVDGSHHQFRHKETGDVQTIIFRNPVKTSQVKEVLRRIGE
jgi:predicted RNA binding protein YcfA (HicA-like mRNA interferase family)